MKKVIIGLALGVAAGMIASEIPQVKKLLDKGKQKAMKMKK